MSIELPTFDPNIEDVLAEIEKESQGSLLLTTPRKFLAGLRSANPCLEQRHITRSKAEQHLIRTHGAELARAIRILVYLRRGVVSPMGTHYPEGASVEFDRRAERAMERPTQESNAEVTSVIDALLYEAEHGANQDSQTDLEALAIAQSLDRSPQNIEYLATAFKDRLQFIASHRVASRALRDGCFTEHCQPHLLEVEGVSLAVLGREDGSFESLELAVKALARTEGAASAGVNHVFAASVAAILSQSDGRIRECMALIELVDPDALSGNIPELAMKWLASCVGDALQLAARSNTMKRASSASANPLREILDALQA